jgi:hypothetical protein
MRKLTQTKPTKATKRTRARRVSSRSWESVTAVAETSHSVRFAPRLGLEVVLSSLEAVQRKPVPAGDWSGTPLAALAQQSVEKHDAFTTSETARLQALLAKVCAADESPLRMMMSHLGVTFVTDTAPLLDY